MPVGLWYHTKVEEKEFNKIMQLKEIDNGTSIDSTSSDISWHQVTLQHNR